MLQDRINELNTRGICTQTVADATEFLNTAVGKVVTPFYERASEQWLFPKDRSKADNCRIELLKILESLQKQQDVKQKPKN
ncbi:MAG: hypothetical protein PHV59_10090 [Victivallales bacterium]|nr:hypothetical protein [Victivallales bacterium]